MQTKIQSISKTKTLDYSELSINCFWQKRQVNIADSAINNAAQIIHALQTQKDSLICIQTEALTDAKLIEVIFEASKSNRIYLLLNEKNEAIFKLMSACLIRFDLKNIGSCMLINPNTHDARGFMFNAQLTEQSFAYTQNVLLDLDNEQIKIFFQHFSYHFWNTAQSEILENEQKVGDSPIDIYPCTQNFCEVKFVKDKLKESANASKISLPMIKNEALLKLEELKNAQIITSFTGNNLDLLKQIKENGSQVFALSGTNPFHLIGDWFIPKITISNDALFYALPLNKEQKEKIDKHFSMLKEAATFEYFNQKSRKDLLDKAFCLAEKTGEEITIIAHSNIQATNCSANELLPKEDFEKQEPVFNDNGQSLSITFDWKNEPYFAPKQAKKHILYKNWEDFGEKVQAFIVKTEAKIAEGEKKESSIAAGLKRFFLGKKTTFSNLKSELDESKNISFSNLSQAEIKQMVVKLNEMYEKVLGEIGEIETEDKKAKIAEEIQTLNLQKDEKEKNLAAFKQKLIENEQEKEKKLAEFYQKYGTTKERLSLFRTELEQKTGKKNKEKNPKEAEESQKIFNELKEIQGFDFGNKVKEDITKIEKELQRIANEISRKEKEKHTPIQGKVIEESSLSLVTEKNKSQKASSTNDNSLQNPNLQPLPQVGLLYETGNQAYLAIEYWEEYNLGKNEAKRLDAKLCTINQ